ncbi:MAG: sporulation protein [Oscillospiraceae bacterium]|jgi:sporulation integral membrane protein YlbJ|nr:sporulation protein [Oscillospiraceae bacterium]
MTKTVNKVSVRRRAYDALTLLGLTLAAAALVIFPEESVAAGKDGVKLCVDVIIPSLMPFFALSSMIVEMGLAERLGRAMAPFMRYLFNVGGVCSAAFILGFIGGYPVGAKTAISLYNSGQTTKTETERLLSFCNNSGPAFILGVVGAGIFTSGKIGIVLCLVHAFSSVIVGILFRFWGAKKAELSTPPTQRKAARTSTFSSAFVNAIKSSVQSMLNISGFVIFFTIFIRLLFLTGILPAAAKLIAECTGLRLNSVEFVLTGIIELTSGVRTLNPQMLSTSMRMAAFMLGWAGLSVHCQALSFICDSGISSKSYIIGKILHGLLSAGLVGVLFRFLPFEQPAAVYLTQQVSGIARLDFSRALLISVSSSAILLLLLLTISAKKRR